MRKYINGVYTDMTADEEARAKAVSACGEVGKLKKRLNDTDYKVIKFAEGCLSAKEYEAIKAERRRLRQRIREIRKEQGEKNEI